MADRMSAEELAETNASIDKWLLGYPLITDTPRDWGRDRNAKCLVRGHDFTDEDDLLRDDVAVCARCGYEVPDA